MRAAPAWIVLLSLVLPVAPADAAKPQLIVRGTRSGYVDVTFDAKFTVSTRQVKESYRDGRIGGFWAERLRQPAGETQDEFGVLRVAHKGGVATARIAKDLPTGAEETADYYPGTYRFHIVADAPFELRFANTTGLPRTVVVAPRRFTAKPQLVVTDGTPGTANTSWQASQQFRVTSRESMVVALSMVRWSGSGTHQSILCFGEPGGGCDDELTVVSTSTDAKAGIGGQHSGTDSVWVERSLGVRLWEARQETYTPPGTTFTAMHGMVLTFDTPAPR